MSKKELAQQEEKALAVAAMFEEDAGAGFEEADQDAYALPFLTILQSNSPQCKRSDGAYIKGAEEGMMLNSVTGELFDGGTPEDGGLWVIPCHYRRAFALYTPRNRGGGFQGEIQVGDPALNEVRVVTNDEGKKKSVLQDGTEVVDTRYHYVLIVKDDGTFTPAVIGMASTQIKKSRQWMSKMQELKLQRADGSLYTPATFSHKYRLITRPQQKNDNSWYGWQVQQREQLTDPVLFQAAREFAKSVKAGTVKPKREVEGEGADAPEWE